MGDHVFPRNQGFGTGSMLVVAPWRRRLSAEGTVKKKNGSENVDAMISFNGASKTYPDGTRRCPPLDLQVRTGEVCTGKGLPAGKSTTMRMVNRLQEPPPGPSASTVAT